MAVRGRRHGRAQDRQAAGGGTLTALDALSHAVGQALAAKPAGLLVVGLAGAQGSGKTTLAQALKARLDADGTATALLSIDDLYLTLAERTALARKVHPLLQTRGVPGTHDVALGLAIIAALERGEATSLPRFDKAADDRLPPDRWGNAPADTRILILEGWCVGARPQEDGALADPVNALERDEDPRGIWRRFANNALAGDYQRLFARIDLLVLLAAPGFGTVLRWRTQQEHDLRRRGGKGRSVMSDVAIARFVQHYERLTLHMLAEMPERADIVICLAEDRTIG
ncbi:MAG: kinase [Sphingobium sp.]